MPLTEALRKEVAPNVDFLVTGTSSPNPAEVLMSSDTQTVIAQVAAMYDLAIIDKSSVLTASDIAIFTPLTGAIFLVVRAEISTLAETEICKTPSTIRLGISWFDF